MNYEYKSTIGANVSVTNFTVSFNNHNYNIRCLVWDLAGQVEYKNVRKSYYQGAHASLLIYDISNRSSYNNIIKWMNELKDQVKTFPIPVVLVANKIDLKENDYLQKNDGLKLVKELNETFTDYTFEIPFIETSAVTGENILPAFQKIGKMLI
jgi:small GTP-binding protein